MAVKEPGPRKRGRPREFDPDAVLRQAMATFWEAGYAATSLEELSAATGLNRPSLYAAFGDKEALYLKALERYRAASRAGLGAVFGKRQPLGSCLREIYAGALDLYIPGSRGCFVFGTATTEAQRNPAVRKILAATCRDLDRGFIARIRRAQAEGELSAGADAVALGQMAAAILHSLAIRSRAGAPRAELEKGASAMVDLICGSG